MLFEGRICGGPNGTMCGGTLTEDRSGNQWVLTAAHCVNDVGNFLSESLGDFVVKGGSVFRNDSDNLQDRKIPHDKQHIIFHPDWKGNGMDLSCHKKCFIGCEPQYCHTCEDQTYSGKYINKISKEGIYVTVYLCLVYIAIYI